MIYFLLGVIIVMLAFFLIGMAIVLVRMDTSLDLLRTIGDRTYYTRNWVKDLHKKWGAE